MPTPPRRAVAARPHAAALLLALAALPAAAQTPQVDTPEGWAADPPVLSALVDFGREESDLRIVVERYLEDRAAVGRRYPVPYSPARHDRLRGFYLAWQGRLEELDFAALNAEGQVDYVLLRNAIRYDRATLRLEEERGAAIAPLVPFADAIRTLLEDRHDRRRADPRAAASPHDALAARVGGLIDDLEAESRGADSLVTRPGVSRVEASRAAGHVRDLQEVLADWNAFYDGYDPLFSWWVREPYGRLDTALSDYAAAIDRHMVGIVEGEPPPIIGDPVLAAGLEADLAVEMIPYTPEELIAIGRREFEWTVSELRAVAQDMGFGDDWKAALEHTKSLAPPPGEKPWVIFDIARYSEDFFDRMDAVTIAPLAREVWRLAMQSPERQLTNPFFSGGEVTRVSYPTDGMTHEDKLMSMRGNTPHFNFATVHHELIPGHHLQGFMTDRFNPHRGGLMRTPFWGEGWALYWELQLYDRDFPRDDPDRIGMLFWRLHRAARIVFSLNYQLGNWSPEEAVDYLVEEVGHERANAEAEVRRSALAAPLYQIGYLIGGLQFRAAYRELVESGRMPEKQFHDAILMGGRMPVELVRARLTGEALSPGYESRWRFYGDPGVGG
jgi:hypothetical protein